MALKVNADYEYGIDCLLVMASNPDFTIPSPARIVGGVGPFDFSGAANPAAVPFTVQIDTDAAVTVNINVAGGVADITAVTVAELVVLLDAAGFADIDFSTEVATNRLLVEYIGTAIAPTYMQVYGECARLADIGQGLGCEFVVMDTTQTINQAPDIRASENIDIEDAQGDITRIVTNSYRQGWTGTLTDTVLDFYLRAIVEGGDYDFVTGDYTTPTRDSRKIKFYMELFAYEYATGENFEEDITGYLQKIFKLCMGDFGDKSHGKNFAPNAYPIKGLAYRDKDGNLSGDTDENKLTIAEYEALDVLNL